MFRNLKKALAAYAEGSKGKAGLGEGEDFPVKEFDELLKLLGEGIAEAKAYCLSLGADIEAILSLGEKGFGEVELFQEYANLILAKDEYRKQLGLYVNTINSLYDSAKSDVYDYPEYKRNRDVLEYLRKVVDRNRDQDEALERAKKRVDDLLDSSISSKGDLLQDPRDRGYSITQAKEIDLSKLNFALLREEFPEKKHKNIQFADLRQLMEIKLRQMLAQNKTRGSFLERFEEIIDQYNTGSLAIEAAYAALLELTQSLSEEATRAARLGMK